MSPMTLLFKPPFPTHPNSVSQISYLIVLSLEPFCYHSLLLSTTEKDHSETKIFCNVLKDLLFYLESKVFVSRLKILNDEPLFQGYNLKIMRSLFHGFECHSALSSGLLSSLCLAWFTELQWHEVWEFVNSNYSIMEKKMCGLKLRGLSDVFQRYLNNFLVTRFVIIYSQIFLDTYWLFYDLVM